MAQGWLHTSTVTRSQPALNPQRLKNRRTYPHSRSTRRHTSGSKLAFWGQSGDDFDMSERLFSIKMNESLRTSWSACLCVQLKTYCVAVPIFLWRRTCCILYEDYSLMLSGEADQERQTSWKQWNHDDRGPIDWSNLARRGAAHSGTGVEQTSCPCVWLVFRQNVCHDVRDFSECIAFLSWITETMKQSKSQSSHNSPILHNTWRRFSDHSFATVNCVVVNGALGCDALWQQLEVRDWRKPA